MKERCLYCILLVAAALWSARAQAAEPFSPEAAKAAIEDGFYDLAQKQIAAYLAKADRYSAEGGQAAVLLARALHGQGRYREILSLIGDLPGRWKGEAVPALAFWKAMACFELGDYARALSGLNGFRAAYPDSPYGPRVERLEAWCALKSGRTNEAFEVFARFDGQYGSTPEGLANRLDWAQALVAAGRDAEAEPLLQQLMTASPASAEGQESRLWMAELLARAGKWEKAWNLLDITIADPAVRADRRTRAWIAVGELNAAQSNFQAAVTAAAKGVELAPTAALKNRAQAAQGRWLIKAGRIDEGAAALKAVVAADSSGPLASDIQLELAGEYFQGGRYENAAEEYQNYLESFTNVAGQVRALKGKGWALWNLKRYAEAAAVFTKAYSLSSDRGEKEQCLFKAADAAFANGQYRVAGETYDKVLAEFPDTALTPQVLYQGGESLARQLLRDKAEGRFRALVSRFPDHPLSERALMRIAEMKEEQGPAHIRAAVAAYGEVMTVYTNGALFADALHRRGLLEYQTRDFGAALEDFSRVVSAFPKSHVAPQAYYMRGWCLYMTGREEEALAVCRSFVEQFPDTEWMPTVLFWIGEFAFNHGDYVEAEKQFTALVDKHPASPMADLALLWAGRAAMRQKEYLRAVDLFTKVATNYPASPRMAEVRFRQGDALSELGEFARAIILFEELISKFPESDLAAAAWGRKGDCQFTLGAADTNRYAEAMASYKAVAGARGATPELKLQALFKTGRCLEKTGRKNEAFETYMKVVYGYLEMEAGFRRTSPGAAVWFTKAAFAAADMLEAERNWRGAAKVLQRVVDSGVAESGAATTRIERLRTEHWLW